MTPMEADPIWSDHKVYGKKGEQGFRDFEAAFL